MGKKWEGELKKVLKLSESDAKNFEDRTSYYENVISAANAFTSGYAKSATKELARNYFPSSSGFGDGAVVPLRQVVVEEDGHGFLEVVGVRATGGVDLFQKADGHAQASDGFRSGDELLSDVESVEDDSLAGSGNVGEHAMFNRVVLRAVRRIVRYTQLQPQAIRQPLEVFLEQVLRRAVAPAAIA